MAIPRQGRSACLSIIFFEPPTVSMNLRLQPKQTLYSFCTYPPSCSRSTIPQQLDFETAISSQTQPAFKVPYQIDSLKPFHRKITLYRANLKEVLFNFLLQLLWLMIYLSK